MKMIPSSAQLPAQRSNNSTLSGKLMWLPSRNCIPTSLLEPVLDNGAYNHPVVVMSNNPSPEGLVEVFLITSFGTRSIDEAFDNKFKHWLDYMPIEPAVHPDLGQLHLLEGSQPLHKPSYVNTRQAHMVHLEALRPHRGSGAGVVDRALEYASVKALTKGSSFVDLFNPRTPKRLRDYKLWVMDDKWRKGEAQAQPLPAGTVVTNPSFPAFSWLAAPGNQAASIWTYNAPTCDTPTYSPPTYNTPTYNTPTYNTPTYSTPTYNSYTHNIHTYSGCSYQPVPNWRVPQPQQRDITSMASWRSVRA
ncbi:hypothetical protein LX32DRAFT_581577 [Colletotrichum zoysiae]|uniref:Uncharacterized protein n=1 Tax=Colletotrichum zoysiae TaxID=1216348 RepID=A0AAD9HQ71_9PEZI|nr:hypothetical protein LX32DRAFT_581577 [Colletotrichum zoysiae]